MNSLSAARKPPQDDQALLKRCGEALFGKDWVSPLARELGVNLRTVQRWAVGSSHPRPDTWAGVLVDIRLLLARRRHAVQQLGTEIDTLLQEIA